MYTVCIASLLLLGLKQSGQRLTVKRLRTPAVSTIDWAAASALGYRPACTLLMQTARGALTTLLPMAAPAPDTKAIPPASTQRVSCPALTVDASHPKAVACHHEDHISI